jgi:hypothetical protein
MPLSSPTKSSGAIISCTTSRAVYLNIGSSILTIIDSGEHGATLIRSPILAAEDSTEIRHG